MKKIVIASACRTAIGKFGGTLANVPAAELGSIVIKEALNRANVKPEQVDHVYMGCVIQAGLGQNVARQASLKAGLPIETPAVTVNVVCGSGLNCVNMAAQMIEAGDADIVVAGGMENMDMAPFALQKARYGYRMGAPMGKSEIVDTMVNDALWDACGFNKHMGMTAENVCTNETYQKKYGYSPITREMLDEFSYNSQLKADKAIKDGAFKDEIVPVVIKGKKGDTVFDTDEGPRLSAPEVLAKLKPAFTKDGIVTAGNSSAINDGAAALVIMSEEKAKELGVKPLATWVAGALAGVGVMNVVTWFKNLLIGLIVAVYLLASRKKFAKQAKMILYSVVKPRWAQLIQEEVLYADKMFGGFINGKIMDSAIIGVLCYIGCLIFKFPSALLVSVIIGVTNVIPFFGPFIGAIPATLLILIQSPIKALWFVLFVLVLQQLDGNVIGPKILGNTTGLSSFWVLFSILLFGGLWGFVGMIVGVPLFAVIYDVIKKLVFHGLRRNGQLDQMTVYHDEFGDPGDPAPAPVEDEGTETEIVIDSGEE